MTALTTLSTLAAHPYPGDGGFHPWFLFFPLGFLLFWVLVAVLVRTLVVRGRGPWGRGGRGPGGWQPGHPGVAGAEHTLATRFASGDIDEQEYRARLEVLRSSPPDPR